MGQGKSSEAKKSADASRQQQPFRGHVVLLGDSTLDNKLYTKGGPSVSGHLRTLLGSRVTLNAKDGAVLKNVVGSQTKGVPRDATHVVVSAGGNNILGMIGIMRRKVADVHAALLLLRESQKKFAAEYAAMLDAVESLGKKTVVLLQYNPRMTHFAQFKSDQGAAEAALSVFIDTVIREASKRRLPMVDMRAVMTEPGDWANPIEPSESGGKKIAEAIARVVREHPFEDKRAVVYNVGSDEKGGS
mmetsp:Transcript_19194/g.38818  ORF Transcript_19194/g.38818 Transcript_19194/m.38818 type:complete len:245 (+) Transcript_19194:69-803(+)